MLSGGEKQKVELVKTILKDADVYFFDEPTAHLDQESRDEYYQYLKKQKDKIIVVVSHNSQLPIDLAPVPDGSCPFLSSLESGQI